jgi:hypothetical protein
MTGSAAYYSSVRFAFRNNKWSPPYPETTGYIIPTLIAFGKTFGVKEYADVALQMGEWLLGLQYADGAFPGGYYREHNPRPRSSFNTGQIMKGLLCAYACSNESRFLDAASRAAQWLLSIQDEDGGWRRCSLFEGFSPSYYTEVCWPLLSVYGVTGNDRVRDGAVRGLDLIRRRQKSNGVISCWGFKPFERASTHTIGYTIRGMLECALLLEDEGRGFWDCGYAAAAALERSYERTGVLAGKYSEQWEPSRWFTCLTGNCQVALCWNTIYRQAKEEKFRLAARSALEAVMPFQFMPEGSHENKGGIPGSNPRWGAYMKFKYPNWAVKYYLDALMEIGLPATELPV